MKNLWIPIFMGMTKKWHFATVPIRIMRIIGGKYRGYRIKQPPFRFIRPTKDRIREAVFNIIAQSVPGSDVLDIFAGSGAYGFEALSRGSTRIVFVDNDKRCIKCISENSRALNIEESIEILRKDAFKAVDLLEKNKERFNIIFSDPPYNTGMAKKTLIDIDRYDILKRAGLLVIEHSEKDEIPEMCGDISILRRQTYGDIVISIFIRK